MAFDLDAARAATPGCGGVAHLNNAGASLATNATLDAMTGFLKMEAAFGGYEAAAMAAGRLAEGRASIARLVNGSVHEIAFTQGAGNGFAKALWGLIVSGYLRDGDTVAVDDLSYGSHHLALMQARRVRDLKLHVVADHREIPESARLVAYTVIGTNCGRVNDLSGVGAITNEREIPFFVDACQAAGQMVVDAQELGADVIVGTGRKWLRGPRGAGFLYVRDRWIGRMEPIGIDGNGADWTSPDTYEPNGDASRFEEFEASIAARIAMGVAVDQALDVGINALHERITDLAEYLRRGLTSIEGVTVHDGDGPRSGIVTFTVDGVAPLDVVSAAQAAGVNINTSDAHSARIDMDRRNLPMVVRASPHAYNTDDELDQLLAVVAAARVSRTRRR